jgi:hypothetical protein
MERASEVEPLVFGQRGHGNQLRILVRDSWGRNMYECILIMMYEIV